VTLHSKFEHRSVATALLTKSNACVIIISTVGIADSNPKQCLRANLEEKSMAANEIVATKGEKSVGTTFDFGGDVNAAVALFGAEVVYSGFVRSAVITAQAILRKGIEAGLSEADCIAKISAWKPGVSQTRVVDTTAAFLRKFEALTPEEQKAEIEKLKARIKR
jgi:hypothetical protein